MSKMKDKEDGIEQITQSKIDVSALPLVMTVDETADLLRVNRKTVYQMIDRNELPGVVRAGRKIRVSTQAVLEWLQRPSHPLSSRRQP